MPPWERESTSLFMQTDGQFWKFHGLKGDGTQRSDKQNSSESGSQLSAGSSAGRGALCHRPPFLGTLLRQQWSKALGGAEPG